MSDGLSWAAAIDTTEFDNGMKRIEEGVRNAASNVEFESERIQALFSDIPEIDIKAVTNMPETADQIGEAYAAIARVQRINGEAINELSAEYDRLTEQINKFQNVPEKKDEVAKWKAEKTAIAENIALRRDMITRTESLSKVVEQNEKAFSKHQKTQTSIKAKIKEVVAEMAALVDAAQQNGETIDETSGRYRELAEELGRLKDIQGDIAQQAKVLSNDENQFEGVISGLSGLSGGFTAAQGAMALFGSENENLQKVMTQLQAVMAITMGLQQMQQMLNKDSAFRLVTLNSLRSLWNKLMDESNTVTAISNAETTTNVAATEAQAAATEGATAAEEANTAAQTANNTATRTGTAATEAQATATEGATAAQNAHTGAMVAGTAATKAMAVATRILKLALISTGIGALIVLVGELVSWITDLISKEDEAVKHTQELNEVNKEAAKTYIQEKIAIEDNIKACKSFNGTKEQEKKKVEELNSQYGDALGYYDSLEQWERILTERGPAYCKLLELKAKRQGVLNKYVEAYCELLAAQHDAENGNIAEAKKILDQWKKDLDRIDQDIVNHKIMNDLDDIHIDPKSKKISGGVPKDTFDPKAAARQRKEAINQWKEAVKQYIKEANAEVNQANIDAMEDGLDKELAQIQAQSQAKKRAWEEHLLQLAATLKASEKAYYMAQKAHTEEGWEASDRGKMSIEDYKNEILNNPENAELSQQYYARLSQITETGETQLNNLRKKYRDKWIKDYGSDLQKAELMQEEWNKRLVQVMTDAPELYSAVYKAMEKDMASLDLSKFKMSINWDEVFGNLDDQSLQSLQYSLDKVKTYFAKAKGDMTVTEIKDFQEAITAMENEIASRNPFTAMHKAFKDINTSKDALVTSLNELTTAQNELNAATEEYNRLQQTKNELVDITRHSDQNNELFALEQAQSKVLETERAYQAALQNRAKIEAGIASGELSADSEELTSAINALTEAENLRNQAIEDRNAIQSTITDQEAAEAAIQLIGVNEQLEASTTRLTTAQTANINAEQRVITARNNVTKSYKQFATQLKAAGGVITDIGSKGKRLAQVFSDDIAASMEKSLDFIDEVLDASAEVISSIGDVGKSVAKGMSTTVDAMGQSTKATAAATATSISTVEKASVILTVISAALQIATAIANLFNDDDSKQKEIERLQERIDQLQWELSNAEAVRLQERYGDAVERLKHIYSETADQVLRLHNITALSSQWMQSLGRAVFSAEIYQKSVEKIADAYAKVDYTATKALGSQKYDESRKKLENLAQQQILIQRQINEEQSKKKTDDGKIQEYEQKIKELGTEMAEIINSMLEDIIGHSAEDLAKTLGDAFFEAAAAGEDAMQAWAKTTNELIADILKRMLITQYLEPEIGRIFNDYKAKWFKDGKFQGVDAVIDSAENLADEINDVGSKFNSIWEGLSEKLGDWFAPEKDLYSQEASKGYTTEMSEDTGQSLVGRTTAIAEATEVIKGSTLRIELCMSECCDTLRDEYSLVNEIHDMTGIGISHLETIAKNTAKLNDIAETLEDIKRKTDDL